MRAMGRHGVKIIATIGPATDSEAMIRDLIDEGVNIFRLNFSHGTWEHHLQVYNRIRNISDEVGIMVDLAGPKIRVGEMAGNVYFHKKEIVYLTPDLSIKGNKEIIPINYPPLYDEVEIGDYIYISDGQVVLQIISKENGMLKAVVKNGGEVTSRKGVNIPGSKISVHAPTEKDIKDLEFLMENMVPDFLCISFVRTVEDIFKVKKIIKKHGHEDDVWIISKIEHVDAVNNFNELLDHSNGIMIARGDLGVELPPEDVPLVQKKLVRQAVKAGVPVIVATQLLDSMIRNPRPTRAEASDVANAILDGADALMLSGETALGNYPLESIQTIKAIARKIYNHVTFNKEDLMSKETSVEELLGYSATLIAEKINADAIIASTRMGYSARMVSKFRSKIKIIGSTPEIKTVRHLQLCWNVIPLKTTEKDTSQEIIYNTIKTGCNTRLLHENDMIVMISGHLLDIPGRTNTIQVFKAGDLLSQVEK